MVSVTLGRNNVPFLDSATLGEVLAKLMLTSQIKVNDANIYLKMLRIDPRLTLTVSHYIGLKVRYFQD